MNRWIRSKKIPIFFFRRKGLFFGAGRFQLRYLALSMFCLRGIFLNPTRMSRGPAAHLFRASVSPATIPLSFVAARFPRLRPVRLHPVRQRPLRLNPNFVKRENGELFAQHAVFYSQTTRIQKLLFRGVQQCSWHVEGFGSNSNNPACRESFCTKTTKTTM